MRRIGLQRYWVALLTRVVCLLAGVSPGLATTTLCGQVPDDEVSQLLKHVQNKLVKVIGASAGRVDGFGTGLIVSNDGLILTAQGVYLDGRQVRVILSDGTEHVATILRRDRVLQLALLKIDVATPHWFEVSDQPVGEKGDWVLAVCNAFKVADLDEPLSVTLGVISLKTTIDARLTERDVAYRGELVLIDAITSNPGAAGGAVVKLDGQLIGMIGKIINSSDTNTRLNYAVPCHLLAAFMVGSVETQTDTTSKIVAEGAGLGIKLFTLGGQKNPAYIEKVVEGGPAAEAGLQADDMIISIAGEKIGNVREYDAVLKKLVPDQEILMIVRRGTQLLRIPITTGAKE